MKVRWMMVGAFLLGLLLMPMPPVTHAQSRDQALASDGGGVTIALQGSPAFPRAMGSATYKASSGQREFEVKVDRVRALAGRTLTVFVDQTKAGMLTISSSGSGDLKLNTQNGQIVPMVQPGSMVTVVTSTGKLVVSGSFPM